MEKSMKVLVVFSIMIFSLHTISASGATDLTTHIEKNAESLVLENRTPAPSPPEPLHPPPATLASACFPWKPTRTATARSWMRMPGSFII